MIQYKRCSEVSKEKVYAAFIIGFSDYIIKMEMSQEYFLDRFFRVEGNDHKLSFIALEGEEPVGLILSGIKDYDGMRTIRCGALCIHPDYRGKGISQELFKLHKQTALENDCKQMVLEVIVGNDRAIKFYNNIGYEKRYDISYFSHSDVASIEVKTLYHISQIPIDMIADFSNGLEQVHINWQNDFDYMKELDGLSHYGAYHDSEMIGALSISANGKIYFIWTLPQYRNKGIANNLIAQAIKELEIKKLSISFPDNTILESFIKHKNFSKDSISQYEMYIPLEI